MYNLLTLKPCMSACCSSSQYAKSMALMLPLTATLV